MRTDGVSPPRRPVHRSIRHLLFGAAFVAAIYLVAHSGLLPHPFASYQSGKNGVGAAAAGNESSASRLSVVATFYPLFEWAQAVGGNRAHVMNLLPTGVEPHDFEPSPADAKRLRTTDLILHQGAGFQPAVDRLLGNLPPNGGPRIINTAEGLISPADGDAAAPGGEEEAHGNEHAEGVDPHTWLDPLLAKRQVDRIATAMGEMDPKNRAFYRANADLYLAQLDRLDAEFRSELRNCARREFVTSHAAFGYLARRYGLRQVAIAGLSPEAEPSPRRLSELARWAKKNGVNVIFFETLASPKVAETLAKEVGAKVLVLNPIEGFSNAELQAGKTYLQGMRENLRNLKIALECKG